MVRGNALLTVLPSPAVIAPRPRVVQVLSYESIGHLDLAAKFRRLVYDVSGDADAATVLMCDHPPSISIGRHGSIADIRLHADQLARTDLHYVAHGGGTVPHGRGQIGFYPVLPLAAWGITPGEYVARLLRTTARVCRSFDVDAESDSESACVMVEGRVIAAAGVAVRSGVSTYGIVLNATPDLDDFAMVRFNNKAMTSLHRESIMRVRLSDVRRRLLESLANEFDLDADIVAPSSQD
jgi:lipoyl(octanoyl) transferase